MTNLQISLKPALLQEGPDYEQAAFGLLEVKAFSTQLAALVENGDGTTHYHSGPYISGYHLAEWLVWNWWRLRWEPRPLPYGVAPLDWDLAHRMTDIGEGYAWPNISFSCDGFSCEVQSERSHESVAIPFSYIGAETHVVPAADFEETVDDFTKFVLQQLTDSRLSETNLQKLWNDLTIERQEPTLSRFRRIEALLGFNPDELDSARIESWLNDADTLGENSLAELATGAGNSMVSARDIADATSKVGFTANACDAFQLSNLPMVHWGIGPAWRIGAAMAKAARQQAGFGENPIADSQLVELAGLSEEAVKSDLSTNGISWAFQAAEASPSIVLRTRRETGRRFDLARLIGDRLFTEGGFTPAEPLAPATRSFSYRQKAQRRFAAELLSPWELVRAMLKGDRSEENREQVAEHFGVSERVISTLLLNNEPDAHHRDKEPLAA